MKLYFLAALLLAGSTGNAQNVGIGNASPASRLQVNYNSSAGNSVYGLHLVDSGLNEYNKIRLSKSSQTTGMTIGLFSGSNNNADKFLDFFSDSAIAATFQGNGRIGVRNLFPAYPLDVNGDINTNGAVRVNGNAGAAGQVLKSNGNGTISWSDVTSYPNMVAYNSGTGSFTVPAGITTVWVEAWGGGSGGCWYAGGGGGGYVSAVFAVTPGGSIGYSVGAGGTSGSASSGNGGTTTVTYTPTSVTLTASGGSGASITGNFVSVGSGGAAFASGTSQYITLFGESGRPVRSGTLQTSATSFYEEITGGDGGNAGNTTATGGHGTYMLITMAGVSVSRASLSDGGNVPGGGGGSGYIALLNTSGVNSSGAPGGAGRVLIHY